MSVKMEKKCEVCKSKEIINRLFTGIEKEKKFFSENHKIAKHCHFDKMQQAIHSLNFHFRK